MPTMPANRRPRSARSWSARRPATAGLLQRPYSAAIAAQVVRARRRRRAHPGDGRVAPGTFGAGARPHPETGPHYRRPERIPDHLRQARRGGGAVSQPGSQLLELTDPASNHFTGLSLSAILRASSSLASGEVTLVRHAKGRVLVMATYCLLPPKTATTSRVRSGLPRVAYVLPGAPAREPHQRSAGFFFRNRDSRAHFRTREARADFFGASNVDRVGQNSVARMTSPHPPGSKITPVAVPEGAACAYTCPV